jgi:DNA-binding response OmpR family regulator
MEKILIIEDDADTLELMEIILRDQGYIVIKVKREISIEEIAGIKPDLVILDFMLPFGLGTEICLELKTNEETKTIPVIMYSANNSVEGLAKNNGADAYMAKPFDVEHLIGLVSRLLGRAS